MKKEQSAIKEKKYIKATNATREALLNAFFMLAHKEKIYQITIREITELANYNHATFYRYFVDIYALIDYAEYEFLRDMRKTIEETCNESQFGERQFFEAMIRCFRKNEYRVSVLLSEENRSHFLRKISENTTNSINRPDFNEPKKRAIRNIYFYGIFYAISVNLQSREALPDEDLLNIIQNLFDNWYRPEMDLND
ncbi:MAG: TetR/AcrR family transcriptional regulator [Lachnospiraceae bacterium]|nr:TetR/AcrR family transcriptional regulator [Lachnospiraceae bacterium]